MRHGVLRHARDLDQRLRVIKRSFARISEDVNLKGETSDDVRHSVPRQTLNREAQRHDNMIPVLATRHAPL